MNAQERQVIIDECDKILKIDIVERRKKQDPNFNVDTISILSGKGMNGINLIVRVLSQLKAESETDAHFYLPVIFSVNGSPQNIIGLIQILNQRIQSFEIRAINEIISLMILYELQYNFWDRGSVNIYNSQEIDVGLKLKEVNSYEKSVREKLGNLEGVKQTLEKDIKTCEAHLTNISNSLKISQDNEKAIQNINAVVSKINGELETTKKNQVQKFDEAVQEVKKLTESNKKYADELLVIDKQKNAIDEELKKISLNEKRVEELTGLISNKVLVYSFARRARLIFYNVIFWMALIFMFFAISCGWLWFSFVHNEALKNLFINPSAPSDFSTILTIVASAVKILPVWILMQFAFKNYSKERHVLEAYEFKAAVAATVKSYADQMINDKFAFKRENFAKDGTGETEWKKYVDERDKARKDLIRETVDNLYKEVKFNDYDVLAEKQSKKDWKRFKEIVSLAKDAAGTVTSKTRG